MLEPVESTDAGEMIAPMSVDSIDQKQPAEQLLEQAKEQNIELVGPDGLLGQLTKSVLETAGCALRHGRWKGLKPPW